MITLLLDRGANVNLPPSEECTSALQAAINPCNKQFIDRILDACTDINAHDPRFGTALTTAAEFGYTSIMRKLLERGAYPDLGGGKYG
jgi:ankyrin repeat protein